MMFHEKLDPSDRVDPVESSSSHSDTNEVDEAWKYLDHHRDANTASTVDLRSLRSRIDWRIVPLLFLAYVLQLLDKVVYNVSSRTLFMLPFTNHLTHI